MSELKRGTVVKCAKPTSTEAGIIAGRSDIAPDAYDVVHGWTDNPPDAGRFTLEASALDRGVWRVATPDEAAKVRALFIEHARAWGPTSAAWVAREVPE